MPSDNNAKIFEFLEKDYLRWKNQLPEKVAIVAVNFFKRNFQVGGFVDRPFKKWKKSRKKSGSTLVKTGNLRRGIRKISVSQNKVVVGVGNEIPYAKIHNEGGKIKPTPKQRRFFWAMFKKTDDPQWRAMALAKEINIPKRQFIGDSKALPITIDRMVIKDLNQLFK